ncbi:TadE/TadG family type IV pilus assembly protein [Roseovarius phycicola]|uniref:TadE/TadG family type IV pilus assembly protein n=1 Tax=Roseovarius phycicola TaxID=3080976 RepID=A0ABZ2HDE5_9RHOB
MIRKFRSLLGRTAREEDGNATIEFVLLFPIYLSFIVMSVELGFITMRHTMIERGMDIAVRELRLGTGTAPQHDEIKQIVCDNALLVVNCEDNLRLEMDSANLFAFNSLDTEVDCTDQSEEARPVRTFTPGQQNQLMLLRACYKYDPLFPDEVLGSALQTDGAGQSAIVSMTAFVQEPI